MHQYYPAGHSPPSRVGLTLYSLSIGQMDTALAISRNKWT